MLERLELNYFKKHEHLVVDFTAGLNGIVGPNWRGKTTVLYGILFCLGGARFVPGKRLQTRGTNSGFRQVLWFSIPGLGRYRIERTKSGAALTELCEDGIEQPVATGTRPVNQAVARLVGMPLKRFVQIKYAKQRAASALLQFGSTELFKIITELTGLERVSLVLDRVGAQLKTWRQVLDEAPLTDLSEQQTQLLAWVDDETELQTEITEIELEIETLQVLRESTAITERRLGEAQTAVYSAETSLRHADREFELAQDALGEAERRLAEFRGAPIAEAELGRMEGAARALDARLQGARQAFARLAQVKDEVGPAQAQYQVAQRKIDPLRQAEADAGKEAEQYDLEALREALAADKAAVGVQSEKLQQLIEDGRSGVCQGCQRPYDVFDPASHAEHVEQQQATVRLLQDKVGVNDALLQRGERAVRVRKEAESTLQRAESALAGQLATCNRLMAQLAEAEQAVLDLEQPDTLKAQLEELQQTITRGRHDGQRQATLADAVENAQGYLRQRDKEKRLAVSALQQIREEHQVEALNLGAALQEARDKALREDAELRRRRESLNNQRGRAQSLAEQRARLERSIEAAAERNRRHEGATAHVGLLLELQEHIRGNRDRYSKQVWDVFMASASLFASTTTGGVVESLTRGEDGAFTFIEDGYEMDQAEASGAQLAIIGTAVQMALADAAQSPLNIVLMDEPTADMDPECALAFSTLLASSGKQVLMVTHREFDGSVFDNTIGV